MIIGLFGNCQAHAIGSILEEHLHHDKIVKFKPVHTMNNGDKSQFFKDIDSLDLLLHQPVGDVYYPVSTENILKRSKVKSIIFPVCYFSPYFVDITYLKNKRGATDRRFVSDYHSRAILSAFVNKVSKKKIVEAFNSDDFFSKELLQGNCEKSIELLKEREAICDIKISEFIENFYKNRNLFFTFNHPTGHVVYHIVNEFLSKISRPPLSNELKVKHARILGDVHWKSFKSIHQNLGLNFEMTEDFYLKNRKYTLDEFVDVSYRFYEGNQPLVDLNLNRTFPSSVFQRI